MLDKFDQASISFQPKTYFDHLCWTKQEYVDRFNIYRFLEIKNINYLNSIILEDLFNEP